MYAGVPLTGSAFFMQNAWLLLADVIKYFYDTYNRWILQIISEIIYGQCTCFKVKI